MLGFPTLIALHSVGMGAAVGLSLMVTLRLNQVLTSINPQLIPRLLTIAAWAFVLNLVTGLALFSSRGSEYVSSAIFLIKMLLVIISAVILFWLRRRLGPLAITRDSMLADRAARHLSLVSAATWLGAVIAGRLIAYLSDLY